jgi:hypothetical protein
LSKPAITPAHIGEAFKRVESTLAVFFPYSPDLSAADVKALALARLTDPSGPEALRGMLNAAGLEDAAYADFTERSAEILAELGDLIDGLDAPGVSDEIKLRATAAWLGLIVGATSSRLASSEEVAAT